MAKMKSTKEVVEEVSAGFNKETMDKIIKTLEYLIAPLCAVCLIWGVDASAYITAGVAVLVSICSFIELFLKDETEE